MSDLKTGKLELLDLVERCESAAQSLTHKESEQGTEPSRRTLNIASSEVRTQACWFNGVGLVRSA